MEAKESYTYIPQEAPNAVQIELAQGCNLGCAFCGIHAIGYQKMARGVDLMSLDTASSLAHQIKEARWNPRIEFAMHGEPTMHPQRAEIIAIFRKALPKSYIMVTSNGGGLLKDTRNAVRAMFDAGLNTLALDNYQSVNIVPKLVEKLVGESIEKFQVRYETSMAPAWPWDDVQMFPYPDSPAGNPHTRHSLKLISIVRDISVAVGGTHANLNNHAGSALPLNDRAAGKRCAKPFRELSVRWDGNVALCCNDWPGVYRCGSIVDDGLLKVWHGPAMEAARKLLYAGQRVLPPCKGCDATSYRVGLLPDKLGKMIMAEPTKATMDTAKKALAKGPYTKPVRAPLES